MNLTEADILKITSTYFRQRRVNAWAVGGYVRDLLLKRAFSKDIDIALPGYAGLTPKFTAGGSLFISSGSRPSRYYQPLMRLSLPLQKHVYWNTEWKYYGYGEQFYLYEGFRAHSFMTGLRLTK